MLKKKINRVKLRIPALKASPSPPVGPMLGQAGLNIMEFCKDFNGKTQNIKENTLLPVSIQVFDDKSFTYQIKSPSTSTMIRQIKEAEPNKDQTFPCISLKQVYEVAKIKVQDESCKRIALESICSNVISTAKSMGLTIVRK